MRLSIKFLPATGVIVLLAAASYAWFIFNYGELSEKPAGALLQRIYLAHVGEAAPKIPIVLRDPYGSKFYVLGVPNENPEAPERIAWMILNESGPIHPVYLIPLDAKIRPSCIFVQNLAFGTFIHPTVLEVLRSKCQR